MKAVFPKKHFHPPKLETEYVVDLGILCCQKKDRDLRKVPNLSAEIAAGEIGEANVENCKIGERGYRSDQGRLVRSRRESQRNFRFRVHKSECPL